MIGISLTCGLGNRLFQCASAIGIAKKLGFDFCIAKSKSNFHSKLDYSCSIFRKIAVNNRSFESSYIEPEHLCHSYCFPEIRSDTVLHGFFQNEKYFAECRDQILDLFEIEKRRSDRLKLKYPNIESSYFIHIRRGDFVRSKNFRVNFDKYHEKCIETLKSSRGDVKFHIFSDDINWCKTKWKYYDKDNMTLITGLDEVDSLYLMSMCKGGICSNSTFSWWGAYLNRDDEKIIFMPDKWLNCKWAKTPAEIIPDWAQIISV